MTSKLLCCWLCLCSTNVIIIAFCTKSNLRAKGSTFSMHGHLYLCIHVLWIWKYAFVILGCKVLWWRCGSPSGTNLHLFKGDIISQQSTDASLFLLGTKLFFQMYKVRYIFFKINPAECTGIVTGIICKSLSEYTAYIGLLAAWHGAVTCVCN